MLGVAQPNTISQESDPGRGPKAHLRGQLSRLLEPIIKLASQLLFKEDNQLTRGQAVFCSAEAEHIDTNLPGDRSRRTVESRNRIREARAVHVHKHFAATREFTDRRYFISRVNCPEFGRLCDANG